MPSNDSIENIKRDPKNPLQNERGIAMLIAIFAMMLTVLIATEIAYESQVEFMGSSQSINRVKAFYAAKAGVELSLFRILLYKKALAQYGEQLKTNKALLDPIWQFPFIWPPTALLQDANAVDKDKVKTLVDASFMKAQYSVTVEAEGGKIDINDLGSENKALAEGTKKQILQIFQNQIENDKKFKDKYRDYNFEKLISYIKDWVDEDNVGTNGDESAGYEQIREAKDFNLPPNAPFKTIAELHMVKDMEDAFYDLLKDKITVFGTKGININYCSSAILEALDPQIKGDKLNRILERRSDPEKGGPFVDEKDFFAFLESNGIRTDVLQKAKLPLLFDAEYNFRIISAGQSQNVRREITAVTYDVDGLTGRYAEILDKTSAEKKGQNGGAPPPAPPPGPTSAPPPGTPPPADKKVKVPKGRPTIVFWQEN